MARSVRTNRSPSNFRQLYSLVMALIWVLIELSFRRGLTVLTWFFKSSRAAPSRQNSRIFSSA